MVEQNKELLELDKIMVDSLVNIIKNKAEDLKNTTDLNDETREYLRYVETILRHLKRLESSESYKSGVFNGNFIKSEIVILNILEDVLKDIEATIPFQDDRMRYLFIMHNVHVDISKIMSILEKYIDVD